MYVTGWFRSMSLISFRDNYDWLTTNFLECIVIFLSSNWSTLSRWPRFWQSHIVFIVGFFFLSGAWLLTVTVSGLFTCRLMLKFTTIKLKCCMWLLRLVEMIIRGLTVHSPLFFPVISSISSTHRHWQPTCNWFQMCWGGGFRGLYGDGEGRREIKRWQRPLVWKNCWLWTV